MKRLFAVLSLISFAVMVIAFLVMLGSMFLGKTDAAAYATMTLFASMGVAAVSVFVYCIAVITPTIVDHEE